MRSRVCARDSPRFGFGLGDIQMKQHAFDNLITDPVDRIQGSHWILGDQGKLGSAVSLPLVLGQCQQVLA